MAPLSDGSGFDRAAANADFAMLTISRREVVGGIVSGALINST